MPNKVLEGYANKEKDSSAVTKCWRYVYEFAEAKDSPADESMNADPSGDAKIWYTQKPDVVKADGNVAALADITVKDGATTLTPSAFDPATGKVTLSTAPAATPTCTYKYANRTEHREIVVEAADMTDPESATEAETAADAAAGTARTAWISSLATLGTKEPQPTHEGNKTL